MAGIKRYSLIVVIIAVLVAATVLFVPHSDAEAHALDWTATVNKRVNDQYVELGAEEKLTGVDKITVIVNTGSLSNSTFYYYVSETSLNDDELRAVRTQAWNAISDVMPGTGDLYQEYEFPGNVTRYIYFRRTYTENSEAKAEYYTRSWHVTVNKTIAAEDLGFDSIKATYLKNNLKTDYYGEWIGVGLTFTVTTKYMHEQDVAYSSANEKLYYSVDKQPLNALEKEWTRMVSNVVTVTDPLKNGRVDFKVTDVAGENKYTETFKIAGNSDVINIDTVEPTFNVSAQYTTVTGETRSYGNNMWSPSDVIFTVEGLAECISDVEYYVSDDGGVNYEKMETSSYVVRESKNKIKFYALNGAGVKYAHQTDFNANIDRQQPGVYVSAVTVDPNDETKSVQLNNGGYANGRATISVYNRDTFGNDIVNASGANFYYSYVVGDPDGEYSRPARMTTAVTEGGITHYNVTYSTTAVAQTVHYRFWIESTVGKVSSVATYNVTVLNSNFEISVEEIVKDKTYVANSSGWAAEPIVVKVIAPSDSKILHGDPRNPDAITGYSTPTIGYTFYYSATDVENAKYSAESRYETYVEGEEGKSVYSFLLNASAESKFSIYAVNYAGKQSKNVYTSADVIKIDTQAPTATLTAYIKPETDVYDDSDLIYIRTGDCVNGRINLTLKVKNGVSGVYLKDLQYAADGSGNPIYDSNGNLVWQEVSGVHPVDDRKMENDGVYYYYYMEIGLPSSTVRSMVREYRYRVYTGSGVSSESPISFVANIDTNEIMLSGADYEFGNVEGRANVVGNDVVMPSVCESGTISLVAKNLSNDTLTENFDYYVRNDLGVFERLPGHVLNVTVPQGKRGTIVKKVYLISKAIDYEGNSFTTNTEYPYTITIPYNTLNISIVRSIDTDGISGSDWVDSQVTVRVSLRADDNGTPVELSAADRLKYSYFYMLIDYAEGGVDLNKALAEGEWISASGDYDGENYVFEVGFAGTSFYGYLALSVTNEAGFRSTGGGDLATLLRIDRTTPAVSDMIVTQSGISERSIASFTTITYYSKDNIIIKPTGFSNRANITYFYKQLDDKLPVDSDGTVDGISANPAKNDDVWVENGWTRLTSQLTLSAVDGYASYYYVFYAVNDLGKSVEGVEDGKIKIQYEFIIDSGEMTGNLSYSTLDGYFETSLNMYAYIWKEQATITLSVNNSNTRVKYCYSLDDGLTWFDYLEPGEDKATYYEVGDDKAKALRFDANYFPQGVMGAFSFKAVNKAGTEYLYGDKIYIAIDTVVPEFELITTVDGLEYNGGDLTLSDRTSANWSSKPVTITVNMLNVNTSGVKLTYIITYLVNNKETSTVEREIPSHTASNISFTTDRLDGFGYNRDAIVTVYATSRANNANRTAHSIRVKVDQVVPVFTLTGHASNDDSTEARIISSGQWTNYSQVAITKAADERYVNVSGVTYKIVYRDLDSTAVEERDWPEGGNPKYDKICSITVTATTDAGLSYSQIFDVNIDIIPPVIKFMSNIVVVEHEKHYIDLKVYVEEENIEICEYITTRGETRGFALDPTGYVISTSSVDNTVKYDVTNNNEEYRGYVKVYVKDYAGNVATFEFYMLPFALNVNNVTLSDEDKRTVDKYEEDLDLAEAYMEANRVTYFRNLISRLRDRINTLENEIKTYQGYLEKLATRTSFSLRSDYAEMFEYMERYNNYELYGQKWIQSRITGDQSSQYYVYFRNFQVAFEALRAEMQEVEDVEERTRRLPAINVVEAEDYDDVLQVFNMYENLSADQRDCFATNLYTKILALKKKCEILLLSDKDTGISLDAKFAPSAKVKVETFSPESEYYTNAQSSILNTVSDKEARAVVSIYNISIKGAASQTETGTVTVNMPIPEEYRQYIKFAVYKMGVDGTITKINDMQIEGDGRSVTFTTDELATFVLAVKANIQSGTTDSDSYGKILGLDLDAKMIRNIAITGAALFGLVIVIVVIAAIRNKRFLNTYNRAYKSGIYRRGIQRIPKGNTTPRRNPLHSGERVKTQRKPY